MSAFFCGLNNDLSNSFQMWPFLFSHQWLFGVKFLQADERYQEERNRMYISKWLRKSIQQYDSYETSLEGLKSFFRDVKVLLKPLCVHSTKQFSFPWPFQWINANTCMVSLPKLGCRRALTGIWGIICLILILMRKRISPLKNKVKAVKEAKIRNWTSLIIVQTKLHLLPNLMPLQNWSPSGQLKYRHLCK